MADRGRKSRPATSQLLEERWYKRDFEAHRAAVKSARSMTDSSPPLAMSMTHVRPNNPKARYYADIRENEIQDENERLLTKMTKIIQSDVRHSISVFGGANIERSLFRSSLNNMHPGIKLNTSQVPVIDHWNAHFPGYLSGKPSRIFQTSYSLADVAFSSSRSNIGSRGGVPLYVAQPAAYFQQDAEFPAGGGEDEAYSSYSGDEVNDEYEKDFEIDGNNRSGAARVVEPAVALYSTANPSQSRPSSSGASSIRSSVAGSSVAGSTRSSMSAPEARQQLQLFMGDGPAKSATAAQNQGKRASSASSASSRASLSNRPGQLLHHSPRSASASPGGSKMASPRSTLIDLGNGSRPQAPAIGQRGESPKGGLVPTGFSGYAFRPGTAPESPGGGSGGVAAATGRLHRYASQEGEYGGSFPGWAPPLPGGSGADPRPGLSCSVDSSSTSPHRARLGTASPDLNTHAELASPQYLLNFENLGLSSLPTVPESSEEETSFQSSLVVLQAALAHRSAGSAVIKTAEGVEIPLPLSAAPTRPMSRAGPRLTQSLKPSTASAANEGMGDVKAA